MLSIGIRTDGSLNSWGQNKYGQLGNNNMPFLMPTKTVGITNVANVVASFNFLMLLKTDGTIWESGSNRYGEIGNGTFLNTSVLTQTGNETVWSKIAAGSNFSVALKNNGTLWSWGSSKNGQLGDNSTSNRNTPAQIGSNNDWSDIFSGSYHTIALKNNGTIWGWGINDYGNLGYSTPSNFAPTPLQIGTDTDWVKIACGVFHSIGLKSNGTIWGWGGNMYHQLGLDYLSPQVGVLY